MIYITFDSIPTNDLIDNTWYRCHNGTDIFITADNGTSRIIWKRAISRYPLKKCVNCGYMMTFEEMIRANGISDNILGKWRMNLGTFYFLYKRYKHLKQLWKDKRVGFLCCTCYKYEVKNERPK